MFYVVNIEESNAFAVPFHELLEEGQRRPSRLEQLFAPHPRTGRISSVRARMAELPPEQLRDLQTTAAAFLAFRQRVSELPPPEFRADAASG